MAKDLYGLVGYPLGHSFSQGYFREKFAREGIDADYVNFEIPSIEDFPAIIASRPNLRGLNVTIPYKEKVMAYLDEIDDAAAKIGAVNVIKFIPESGILRGYNSDVIGFCESISPLLQPWHKRTLVLGTGGAAKAIWQGLVSLGIEPVYVSRTPAAGRLTYADLTPEIMADHTVIVNTTPLGMSPKVDACAPIPYDLITPRHLCYDVVYNPLTTKFMRESAQRGATVKNGLDMLHGQAIAAWRIWTE